MDIMQNAFVQKYTSQMVEHLKNIYPSLPVEYLEKRVIQQIRAQLKDQPVSLQNSYTGIKGQSSLLNIAHWIETEEPIIAGNGSFYQQHSISTAPANNMLIHQKKQRGILKKKSFELRNKGDENGYMRYNIGQNNEKIKMNSYYGAMGQSKSFQYNVSAAGAITSQGRSIISLTTWFNESFIANNVIFDTFDDIEDYISQILKEENHLELYSYISYIPTDEEIVRYLMSHFEERENRVYWAGVLLYQLRNIDSSSKIKIYYKNNLNELINRNPKVEEYVLGLVNSQCEYMNPYAIPKDLQEPINYLWTIVNEFVFMKNYIVYNKVHKYLNHTRRIVLYSDTDSVMIATGHWTFNILEKLMGIPMSQMNMIDLEKDTPRVLKIINILTNLIYIGIHQQYDTLCNNIHICEEYKPYITIKNEFLMDRFIMFDIKKNYIYRELVNEGNILNPPNVEVKGGNLNPKAKNKLVTKRIKKIVEEVTMITDKIYPELLVRRIFEFRNDIVESLKKGEVTYLIPTKVKTPDQYDNPYSQFKFRGVEAYRIAMNDVTIHLPGSFNVLDVSMEKLEDLNWLKENYPDIYTRIETGVFGDAKLKKYGIMYICLPMTLTEIPKWIVPYIDAESIWRKHLNPLIALLPSLGVRHDNINTDTYYSTVLKI